MERVAQHYRRQLLLQAVARWKVHHLSCIRKRVRQTATPRVPLCGGAVWARRPHREEERSFQKHLLLLLWMLGVLRAQGCPSGCSVKAGEAGLPGGRWLSKELGSV